MVSDLIGENTRAELFALVLTAGPISRGQLAKRLNLSPSAITRLLPPLLEHGFLRESPGIPIGPGRPQRLLHVNTDRHTSVGVKITPTHITGVVTDLGAEVLVHAERPLPEPTPANAVACATGLVAGLLDQIPQAREKTLGLGVGVSGHVDAARGICRYSALLGWENVDIAGPLATETGLPVTVNNDLNTLVVAERWFGQGRDVNSFAVVTVGPGIGCGLLLNGTLYSGASGMAGELGHMPVDPAGPECGCGSRGCLETLASSGAVLRSLRESGHPDCAGISDIADAYRLARTGAGPAGHTARSAFASAGDTLGRGLAGLCNLLNLEKIILAGEGVVAYDLFGPAMHAALEHHAFSVAARDCTIQVDPVTDDRWARGAACLVIRETVRATLS